MRDRFNKDFEEAVQSKVQKDVSGNSQIYQCANCSLTTKGMFF